MSKAASIQEIELDDKWLSKFRVGKYFDQLPVPAGEKAGSNAQPTEPPKVESLDFHQAEPLLVVATTDNAISLYDSRTGSPMKNLLAQKYGIRSVCFTHHPQCIVYASSKFENAKQPEDNHAIRYHSLFDNAFIRYFKGHVNDVTNVQMSKCSDCFYSASKDKTVKKWDLRVDRQAGSMEVDTMGPTILVAVDNQESLLAVGVVGGGIKLYSAKEMEKGHFYEIIGPSHQTVESIHCLKFSNDANMVAVAFRNEIALYDISIEATSKAEKGDAPKHIFRKASEDSDFGERVEFCFTPDDKFILSGCEDGTIKVWRTGDGKEVVGLKASDSGAKDLPLCLKWSPHSALFATGSHFTKLWVPES
jgi:COMPASS component SWD2